MANQEPSGIRSNAQPVQTKTEKPKTAFPKQVVPPKEDPKPATKVQEEIKKVEVRNSFITYMKEYIRKYSRLDEKFISETSPENLAAIYDLISSYERKLAIARIKNPLPVAPATVAPEAAEVKTVNDIAHPNMEQEIIAASMLKAELQEKIQILFKEIDNLKINYANVEAKIESAMVNHLREYSHIKINR